MDSRTKDLLQTLAEKYEVKAFADADPSRFLQWYKAVPDVEVAAFIAAMLSFGNRKQFIPKISQIFELADGSGGAKGGICRWITSGQFEKDFCSADGDNQKKFYRFYSYNDMIDLFRAFARILNKAESFGEYLRVRFEASAVAEPTGCAREKCYAFERLLAVIAEAFAGCSIVPKGRDSANKRIHMFLRWMVRRNSPVDLGLWEWYSPADLIIPLDTHVIQQSVKLGLIGAGTGGTLKTALLITKQLKEIWQEDPCKGDFALFGLGVDS